MFTPPSIDTTARRDMVLLTLLAFGAYCTGVDFLMRGDAALYSDFVLNARFDDISLHIGYYALGFLLDRAIGRPLGVPIHEMWVYLNVVCGALAMPVVYLLARQMLGSRLTAFTCTLIFMFCGRVVMNATTSEVYMSQTLVMLLSFLHYVRNQTWRAALFGGLALYISPLSAFAYLFFPAWDYLRTGSVRWRHLTMFAAAGIAVYSPYLLMLGDELLWGRRGLLVVNELAEVRPEAAMVNLPKFQLKHYTVLLLLLIPALFAWRRFAATWLLAAAVALPHLYIVMKLVDEENVFLMNTDFFFALLLTTGAQAMSQWLRDGVRGERPLRAWRTHAGNVVAAFLLAMHIGVLVAFGNLLDPDRNRGYAGEMREIADTYLSEPGSVVIANWDISIVLTYFGRQTVAGLVEDDPLFTKMLDFAHAEQRARSLERASSIYVIDAWAPSSFSRLFLSSSTIEERRNRYSIRPRAERYFGLRCVQIGQYTHALYRCARLPR